MGEDAGKILQGESVSVIHVVKLLQNRIDVAASIRDLAIFFGDALNLSHDALCLPHFSRDDGSLLLQCLKRLNDIVIVKDVSARFVERLEESLLKLP